jgi:molybdopterin molybdotransferase
MTPPLPLEEAQARLLASASALGSETVMTGQAVGRWLAEPMIAGRSSPEADLSAMDGFATAGPPPWRVVGKSAAGRPWVDPIGNGQSVRISTGAHLPPGADAILIREDAELKGDLLHPAGGSPSVDYIRRAGFDFTEGDAVLSAGTGIGAAQLALALAAGVDAPVVGRLPRVAIIDTGDELYADPSLAGAGMVPASNGSMLAALCAGLVSSVNLIGPVPDQRNALRTAFAQAAEADVIVSSGGASVGDHDLIRPVLQDWGAELDFWRVAIRPGKPLLVARRGSQHIVGLPGNPVSAYVTALLFVLPLLRKLAGAPDEACLPRRMPAVLARAVPPGGARREFLRGKWNGGGVEALPQRDSSALRSLASAELLIDRAAGASASAPGETVSVILLQP